MRLLLVEDHPDLQSSLAKALRKDNFAVDVADDGQDGLWKAEDYDYDAIILDVMLPKMDGYAFLAELRKQKKTPVLILTARDSVEDKVRGLDSGADDYLVKPFELSELIARVRALIRRSAGAPTSVIEVGDFTIDSTRKQVSRKGDVLALTAQEFSLVEYLALNRGRVVSRTMLYEHLFDEDESSLSNTLDVKVSRIRSKVGKDLIKTHRGHGYSIE